ncbi:hypothetical protein DSO57_1001573 [Entomophthora muscae]|uniref:Uncharacterized protein n=1 Tax=Entomophthora muscae TaxID=34485 RepID=A0ACC2SB53_9FUNG|nr:hypothetical protein DSO57_1001573 [Entomophthora muscae]
MKEIPTAPPLPNAPPTQDFRKLGFVYITVLGLANQVVPHTGSWRPLSTSLNYLVCIVHIVYMAFQAQPASPVGVHPDSGLYLQQTTKLFLGQQKPHLQTTKHVDCHSWVPGIKSIAWLNLVCLGRSVAMVSENTDFHLSKQADISPLQGAITMLFNRGDVWVVT